MDNIKFYTKEYWAGYYDACRHLSSSTRMNKPQLEVIEELGGAVKGKLESLGVEFTAGKELNPLGGASRGYGRCTCAAGPGTNPSCPVHP